MNPLFADRRVSIFEHMSGLARDHDAVNLGQGFPDFGWPDDVVMKAAELLGGQSNQYPPMRGLPDLREAVAAHYAAHHGIQYSPDEVIVTSGATEALASAMAALISPGDEVVMFQPLYDAYVPLVRRAGGVPRFVTLTPPDWRITEEALTAAITERTRLLILNNPHNPTARMFGWDELEMLADACVRHDVVVVSDEVWEHVVFDGRAHEPIARLPGMAERTVKIGSAGKVFSLTGWKVGWFCAPAPLGVPITGAHQYIAFTTPPNLQGAVAYGLGKDIDYYLSMRAGYAASRDRLAQDLVDIGYAPLQAAGSYFMCVDLAASGIKVGDVEFCERTVREAGVAAIPLSAFYESDAVTNVIRLCFAKREETLAAGIAGLKCARELMAG